MPLNAGNGRSGRPNLLLIVAVFMNSGDMTGEYRYGIMR